jgi:hypothetical protein
MLWDGIFLAWMHVFEPLFPALPDYFMRSIDCDDLAFLFVFVFPILMKRDPLILFLFLYGINEGGNQRRESPSMSISIVNR